jgi:hypothetical protein
MEATWGEAWEHENRRYLAPLFTPTKILHHGLKGVAKYYNDGHMTRGKKKGTKEKRNYHKEILRPMC